MSKNLKQNIALKHKLLKNEDFQFTSINGLKNNYTNIFFISRNETRNPNYLNLLFFENNNVNPKVYFDNERKKNQKQMQNFPKVDNYNNKIPNKINSCNSDSNSFSSLDISDSELNEDDETKKKRKQIIKDMKERTDYLELIEFDKSQILDEYYDYLFLEEENIIEKEKENYETNESNKKNSKIKLIKKAKLKFTEKKEKNISCCKNIGKTKKKENPKSKIRFRKRTRSKEPY